MVAPRIEGMVVGTLAALGPDPSPDKLIGCMRSEKMRGEKLSEGDCYEYAKLMIAEGFAGNPEHFIFAR